MREHLKASDIANNISMLRSVFDGTILVVEGPTDLRLFGKMLDEGCEAVAAHSKDNVRSAVKELHNRRKDRKVLGIMDSDMDRLSGDIPSPPLFLTDTRDAEIMMIRCHSLEKVLWEYCDRNALDLFTDRYGGVREAIMNAAYPLGILMHLSKVNDYCLSFKDLDFSKFIDPATLRNDVRMMVDEVISGSKDPAVSAKEARTAIADVMEDGPDPWIVCRGHDAVQILLIGLKRMFGGYNSRSLGCGELSGALRLAFGLEDLIGTSLFRETSEWAESNGNALWVKERPGPL